MPEPKLVATANIRVSFNHISDLTTISKMLTHNLGSTTVCNRLHAMPSDHVVTHPRIANRPIGLMLMTKQIDHEERIQCKLVLLWHHVSLFLVLASKLRVQTSSLCPPGFKSIGTCSAGLSQHTSLHCLPHFTLRVPLSITVLLQWLQRLFQPSLRCPALGFWLACLEPCSQTIHIHLRPYSTHDHTITYT